MNQAPEFIRVKRRRDEDAVQALLFEEEQLKKKRSKFVFKLTKTINQGAYINEEENFSPLLKLSEGNHSHRHFVLEQDSTVTSNTSELDEAVDILNKSKTTGNINSTIQSDNTNALLEDTITQQQDGNYGHGNLPADIAKMVNDYLKLNDSNINGEPTKRQKKPSRKHFTTNVAKLPSLDYVYDIYHLEKIPENEEVFYQNQNVGFIKVVNKDIDLIPDEDTDNEEQLSDDEDSNDENFYQNDYPEDEDDDRSILFGSENDEFALDNDVGDSQWRKLPEVPDSYQMRSNINNTTDNNDIENHQYDELFDKLEGDNDILTSLKNANIIDMDSSKYEEAEEEIYDSEDNVNYNQYDEDEEYKRNEFFASDIDNPLAQHRDKIFGRLEKLINERK